MNSTEMGKINLTAIQLISKLDHEEISAMLELQDCYYETLAEPAEAIWIEKADNSDKESFLEQQLNKIFTEYQTTTY